MDISDYSNRLAEARESYHKKGEEVRRNYDTDRKNLESTHEARENNQRQIYNDSKRELENDLQNITTKQSERSKEETDRLQKDYNNQMRTAREDFERESNTDRHNFAQRLGHLRESFDRNTRLNEAQNKEKFDSTTERFQDTIQNDRRTHARDMHQLQENSNGHYQNYREQVANDTKEIIKKKDEDKHEVVRQSNLKQSQLKDKLNAEMHEVNKAREAELAKMRDDQHDQVNQLHALQAQHNKGTIDNYDHLMSLNQQRNNNEQRELIASNNEKVRMLEKDYNKDLNSLERRAIAIANSGGRGDEARNELERVKRVDEDRIARMKNNLEDAKIALTEDKAKMMDKAQKTLKDQALKNYKVQDTRDKQVIADRAKQTDKFRRERDQITEQLAGELRAHKESNSKSLVAERLSNKSKYNTQREDYARRMNHMSEKNLQTIASIQEEQARDKTAFIEKAKRDVYEAKEELKDEVTNRLQKTSDVHETKVRNLEAEKEKLISSYEDRLMNIAKKSVAVDQQRTMVEEQRRQEDLRTAKRIQEGKDFETAKVIQSLRQEFDKNLNEIGHANEVKFSRMSKRYEDIIDRMTKENNLEIHRREAQLRENYERLAKTSELQKAEIENKYELKIQKMKENFERAREVASTRGEASKAHKIDLEDDLA